MRVLIAAIGKAKASPEQQLYHDYIKRLPWKCELKELEAKFDDQAKRKTREGELLLDTCQKYDRIIALDENGKQFSSREFAAQIKNWQQQGASSFAFVIGGADGLDASVLKKSHLAWSLGKATWPHMLVRVLLAEQLYRAHSILTGHPYHRD
jgi:23S rRNA (pseudouridine1915-N3)-methyltransferase